MEENRIKVIQSIKRIVKEDSDLNKKLEKICYLLHKNFKHFNWVGFYLADEKRKILTLGPFVGEPTQHFKINFGEGICGQAALKKTTFIVDDVSKEENYLACSPLVKSEIVVPIFKNEKIVAELDIDSHYLSSFSENDKIFLEKIAKILSDVF